MSRTFRNVSKQMAKYYDKKKVRDGTPTRFDKSCKNHGSCPYCKGNRLYKNLKRLDNGKTDI
ncbi:hypothetical protein [Capnocytophaga cynodegmi]|uniref:hypothetical protein n=1 Tax=Capnocytophaga cynodegmi TaxID=28189 RepID=UPI001BB389CE|nr:hypothetical protein [Capnocytophaga cynodegmi]